eukprot:SAG31_NODE_11915_length_986_cov_1.510710_1_plen_227_part_10
MLASSGSVKDEIITLLAKDQHADLQKMKIGGLRKRAISLGIDDTKIEEALDADDAKAALIALIIKTVPEATPQTPAQKTSDVPSSGWVKPKRNWRPPNFNAKKRFKPGKEGSAQAMLSYAVWFVNTTRQGPRGSMDLVEEALEKGADIDFQTPDNNGMTAVMQACSGGAGSDVVELLIDKGADTTIRDFNGFSMIDSAVAGARTDILDKLLALHQTDLNVLGKDGYA